MRRRHSAFGWLVVICGLLGSPRGVVAQQPEERRIGFEILNRVSPSEIVVWINYSMTQEAFDAIELPFFWFKNQPREGEPDASRFLRSPDAGSDGPLIEEELFGHTWRYNAKVVKTRVRMDAAGLLEASHVVKHHEIKYWAGKKVVILVSPDGESYLRVSRDANRTVKTPTVPDGWQLVSETLNKDLILTLPNPTVNIRADNEDSFQGPISRDSLILGPKLWLAQRGFSQHTELASDPDGDGVPLLIDYALGREPGNGVGPAALPVISGEGRLEWSVGSGRPGVQYRIETSADLRDWTDAGVELAAPGKEGKQRVSMSFDATRQFLRLVLDCQ